MTEVTAKDMFDESRTVISRGMNNKFGVEGASTLPLNKVQTAEAVAMGVIAAHKTLEKHGRL
jgi:hypothetical protein